MTVMVKALEHFDVSCWEYGSAKAKLWYWKSKYVFLAFGYQDSYVLVLLTVE